MLLLVFIVTIQSAAQNREGVVRVACVGNSITYGAGIENRERDSYPAVLGQLLGADYDVRNFGYSARTMLMKGDYPYMKETMYKDALDFNPDIVVIKLGTNDTKPQNWKYHKSFANDMQSMISAFKSLPSKPRILLCYPAKVYKLQWGINDSIIMNGVIPVINKLAKKNNLEIIDLHTATDGMSENFPDAVHPNPVGAHKMAEVVYKHITGKEATAEMQRFPGLKSKWNGCDRYDFKFKGRDAIVVVPSKAAKGNPWIFRPAFFDAFPSVDKALLERGFHVAYLDVTYLYGSPYSCGLISDFYSDLVTNYHLSDKVTVEGFSRGGLSSLVWASQNSDKIACIYLDAPVCDVFSWPYTNDKKAWGDLLNSWDLTEKEALKDFKGNPINLAKTIAESGIPILCVCGDSDKSVPFDRNFNVFRSRYISNGGGPIELIIKEGVDHHPHSLENPEPIVDFVLRYQQCYEPYLHYNVRGSLSNSFSIFENERHARVAFLGGSITEMKGWRDMVKQQLRQRFPYTRFEWVDAGISSTGSTPGAFRLQHDVLSKGKVDLLFIDESVNDCVNGFTPEEQVRGVEGVIRHALSDNPYMDIVMLHFIHDDCLPSVLKGSLPDAIFNHERVANHYNVPSVNLCKEIGERLRDGEFSYEEFGGTHPNPFGHKYYAAAIARLFDKMWRGIIPDGKLIKHDIPEKSLDQFSYVQGDFGDICNAVLNKGWRFVENWHPTNNVEKRAGFVDVPMLEAYRPGDKLTFDFIGRAIGIFCLCGPSAGILEYSVDNAPFKAVDTYTEWSAQLYLPWVYMLETELKDGKHRLVLRISKDKNPESQGTECQIRNFVINK